MTCIINLNSNSWKEKITISNENAMGKSHKYPIKEEGYFLQCLEYVPLSCEDDCNCKKFKKSGVWVLRDDVSFEMFLYHYVQLWVRGSSSFIEKVNNKSMKLGRREKNSIALMRIIKEKWDNWDGENQSLPSIVNKKRYTYLCSKGFSEVGTMAKEIHGKFYDNTGVYTSKLLSQLFPDIAIPFDTESKKKIRDCGYQPIEYGNGEMRRQVLNFLENNNLTLDEFRKLDTSPLLFWPNKARDINGSVTSVSRVIDKLFYS